jgi:flagellar hook-associated protein 1 FlgK
MTGTGLPWAASNGVFYVEVTNAGGVTNRYQVAVEAGIDGTDATLNDLVTALNAACNGEVTASVDGSNRLRMVVNDASASFTFSGPAHDGDATNVLAVLGVNAFFQGESAVDVEVRADLTAAFVVAGSASDVQQGLGNGAIAGKIGQLATTGLSAQGGQSLTDVFTTLVGRIATDAKAAQDNYTAADVVLMTLENERQGVSGVSLDEEAIHMITYQRAFQGSARFVSVINEMLEEIIALAR